MTRSRNIMRLAGVLTGLMINLATAQPTKTSGDIILPSDADIRNMLMERIDTLAGQEDGIGIVVGIIAPESRKVISYGHRSLEDQRSPDGNTVFEIASVTKVFTALLLADMVQNGEVSLTDPVVKYLPTGVKLPERNGRSITLADLATHTSGLPFMPAGEIKSTADLYRFLAGYELTRDIGAGWDYSNIGYWLLSEMLASRAAMEYERLFRTRVVTPLKLMSTSFSLSAEMKANLAPGHDAALQPAPAVSTLHIYSLMPAAGGLYSTINDLLTLLSVGMGYEHGPLDSAFAACLVVRRPTGNPRDEQALGWTVIGKGNDQLIFRDGGSYGYASCIVWDPAKRVGVAVLSNQAASVADLALHLLRPSLPLEHPRATKHKEIALETSVLSSYAGKYEAPGEGIFSITLEGDSLMIEAPAEWGLPKLRIRPESAVEFFALELPLRVTLDRDVDGHVTGIVIHPPRGQKGVSARRIRSDR